MDYSSLTEIAGDDVTEEQVGRLAQNTRAHRAIVENRRKDQVVIDLVHLGGQVPHDSYQQLC